MSARRAEQRWARALASRGAARCALVSSGLAWCALASCAAPSSPDAALDAHVEPSLEIGGGLASYLELPASGGELELVHGPQGGWHVNLSLRARGIVPMSFSWRVMRDDGRALAYFGLDAREGSFVTREGALERVGELVILDVTGPDEVVGREVHVEAVVRDVGGRMLGAELDARVVDLEP